MKKMGMLAMMAGTLLLCPVAMAKKPEAGGAAAGANSTSTDTGLRHCAKPYGTLAVVEEQESDWYRYLTSDLRLPSTVPMLRLMIQQSNCFVVVERGRAMDNAMQERALAEAGELRSTSRMGKGQMVAADYTMSPSIRFSQTTGGGAVGGLLRGLGGKAGVAGALLGGIKRDESSTVLTLIDNRSTVQISAAEGNSKSFGFALGGIFSGAGAGGFASTPEGKRISAAFADAYNKMVEALASYRAQEVDGGLGAGGNLPVGK
ncbi:MAG: CsgG/HfaB family protein [Lysobacter sp.]|nr:CsgG/HfaB family protein [Lysobacter sp.]